MARGECVELLAHEAVGRVVFVHGALPEVVPVAQCLSGESVVFGVYAASPLAGRIEGTVVTFQANSFEPKRESGGTSEPSGDPSGADTR